MMDHGWINDGSMMDHTENDNAGKAENNLLSNEEHKQNENGMQRVNSYFLWCRSINFTVEPVICAVFLALNLCDVSITNLIMYRVCKSELKFSKMKCDTLGTDTLEGHHMEILVQPSTSFILMCKNLLSTIFPAIMLLFLGPWSDYHGRKFLILAPTLGLSISFLLYAIFSYVNNIGPFYFLLAVLPFSLSGGVINLISACYSYISDISTEQNRALRLSLLESWLYLGTIIGVINSYYTFSISKKFGYIIVFSIGALISLVAFLYSLCFVKESVRRNEESSVSVRLFQLKFLKESFLTSFKRRENYGRTIICLSMFSMVASIISLEGESSLLYLFTRLQFSWNLHQFSTWFAVAVATHLIGLVLGSIVLTKIFKISDAVVAVVSYFVKFGECVFFAFIPSKASHLMYWAQSISFLGGLSGPALRSVLSKTVPKEDVGKIFSLVTFFESVFPLVSTPLYVLLYNSTINFMPGMFFMLSSLLFFLSLIFCCIIWALQKFASGQNYARLIDDDGTA